MESSRRKMLQKTALFVVPTLVTFNLKDIQANVSGAPSTNVFGAQSGGNGNHYGNDKPDQNNHDTPNSHNGWDDTGWKNNNGHGQIGSGRRGR